MENPIIPPSLELPPLPEISSSRYSKIVFSHSSLRSESRDKNSLELVPGAAEQDNEKLEHVGDSVLGVTVTLLLHELFPDLPAGSSTKLKARLVSNETNRQIAFHYNLMSCLQASSSQLLTLKSADSSAASDLFEAYVAGLFYSYYDEHRAALRVPSPPLTPHKGVPISSAADEPSPRPKRSSYGEALDRLEAWLRPLYTPLAQHALEQMRFERSNGSDNDLEQKAMGALALLNQHCIARETGIPQYTHDVGADGMWKCECVVTRKDGSQLRGNATCSTKKLASTVAAYQICKEMGLIKDD